MKTSKTYLKSKQKRKAYDCIKQYNKVNGKINTPNFCGKY